MQWCDQARRSCEEPGSSDLENLTRWLNAIDEGLRLRRQLDGLGPDETIESSRREVVRRLTELQLLADRRDGEPEARHARRTSVSRHGSRRGWPRRGPPSGTSLTGLRLGPLHQAMAIEGLRADLEWLSTLVARLDGETPHPVTRVAGRRARAPARLAGHAAWPRCRPARRAAPRRLRADAGGPPGAPHPARAGAALGRLERRRALGRAVPSLAAPDAGRDAGRQWTSGGQLRRPFVRPAEAPRRLAGSTSLKQRRDRAGRRGRRSAELRSSCPAAPKPASASSRRLSTKSVR